MPPKISMKQDNNVFYNVMPCILPTENIMGVKIVTRQPKQIPSITSQILLYDLDTGKLMALIDGNLITAMRTGAVAVHSLNLLAKEDYDTIGLIGLGVTTTATMDIYSHLFPNDEKKIKLFRYKDQAENLKNRYNHIESYDFEILNTPEEVISNSDIIISGVTYAEENFADDKYFAPGCMVIPIHSLGFQNCDLFFDKVFADDTDHVSNFKYFSKFKSFAEVADVVNGNSPGRESQDERILVYNIGLAIHDVYCAYKILSLTDSKKEIDMSGPNEKMWL